MSKLLDEKALRERLTGIFYRGKMGINYDQLSRLDEAVDLIKSQKQAHADMVIGDDGELITPEKYDELYPSRSFKADAAVHYQNKAIAANNKLRSDQRERNKL